MHAWESIQKTLDYIETNLAEEMKTEDLAALAALSPFYYQRLFSRLVKRPVMEYIKLRRLAKACELLAEQGQKKRILDVALDTGFGSHETFTRAFREAYEMTPEQYRAGPVWLNQFDKPDLLLNYVMIDEGVPLISDGLVLEMNRQTLREPVPFMGLAGYVPVEGQIPVGEGTGVDVPGEIWGIFHRVKEDIPRLPGGREVGVAYFGDAPEGNFTYFTGAEVTAEEVGKNRTGRFQTWSLPAGEYIVCSFEAEDAQQLVTVAVNKAVKFSRLWLEQHGLTQEAYSPEIYPESPDDGAACMELWIPAVKGENL